MTGSAALEHVSVLYRSDEELVDLTAADAEAGLDAGQAVLVCLPDHQWKGIARRLGPRAAQVTHIEAGDRYARPIGAMRMLHDFLDEALAAGARGVRSIGEIAYTGTAADTPWLRYEAAVNEVFAHVPLRAVCVTDARTAPPGVLDAIHELHGHDAVHRQSALLRELPPAVERPDRTPDLSLVAPTPREARVAVAERFGGLLGPDVGGDVQLVLTELLVNADRYAPGPATARLWLDDDAVVVSVADRGAGIDRAAAGFDPNGTESGGRGLWIVQHLSAVVDFTTVDGEHAVTALVRR